MRIVFATRNSDKVHVVSELLFAIVPSIQIVPLRDLNVDGECEERGTIEERAQQKARFFFDILNRKNQLADFDGVLGVDDGFSVEGNVSPHSKEITDSILSGQYPIGQEVVLARAFCLKKKDGSERTQTTFLPFVFLGNQNKVTRQDGKYPLSQVLAPKGMDKSVVSLGNDEHNAFNIKHSKIELLDLF